MTNPTMKGKKILYLGIDPTRFAHKGLLCHLPLIRIVAHPFEGELKTSFENMTVYSHVLFTSRTAVNIFQEYALKAGFPLTVLQDKIYISVGSATTESLHEANLSATHTAQNETGEGVVELLESLSFDQAHLFFPRSALARSLIPTYMHQKGIRFTAVDLYETLPNHVALSNLETFDEIIFTSPSIVHAFFSLSCFLPPREKCISIGPVTEKALNSYFLMKI
jgi:uroporphyrinogen-III synthase